MPCIYIQLSYEEYKSLEEQMRTVPETEHRTVPDGGYHKAIRLEVKGGSDPLVFEFQGPVLKGFPNLADIISDGEDHADIYTRISKMVKVNRNAVKRIILAAGYTPSNESALKGKIKRLEDEVSRLKYPDTTGGQNP